MSFVAARAMPATEARNPGARPQAAKQWAAAPAVEQQVLPINQVALKPPRGQQMRPEAAIEDGDGPMEQFELPPEVPPPRVSLYAEGP